MTLLILCACPAQWLDVELPEGGAGSISQEDLQRDTLGFSKEDPEGFFRKRAEQMNVERVEHKEEPKETCAVIGSGEPQKKLIAPWPHDPKTAAQAAVLISLAKGFDGNPPPFSLWLCLGEPANLPELPLADTLEAINYVALASRTRSLFESLNTPQAAP